MYARSGLKRTMPLKLLGTSTKRRISQFYLTKCRIRWSVAFAQLSQSTRCLNSTMWFSTVCRAPDSVTSYFVRELKLCKHVCLSMRRLGTTLYTVLTYNLISVHCKARKGLRSSSNGQQNYSADSSSFWDYKTFFSYWTQLRKKFVLQ